jgi:hypothetical protein
MKRDLQRRIKRAVHEGTCDEGLAAAIERALCQSAQPTASLRASFSLLLHLARPLLDLAHAHRIHQQLLHPPSTAPASSSSSSSSSVTASSSSSSSPYVTSSSSSSLVSADSAVLPAASLTTPSSSASPSRGSVSSVWTDSLAMTGGSLGLCCASHVVCDPPPCLLMPSGPHEWLLCELLLKSLTSVSRLSLSIITLSRTLSNSLTSLISLRYSHSSSRTLSNSFELF